MSCTLAPAIIDAEWPAVLLDQDALLGAHLGSVSGVWASRIALEAALAHHAVGGLPLPAHAAQLLALADQIRPDLLQHTVRGEALKPAVNGRGSAEALGQLVPLAARAQPVDDPVQHQPQIGSRTAGPRRRIEALEDRLDSSHSSSGTSQIVGSGQAGVVSTAGKARSFREVVVPCRFNPGLHNSCPPKSFRTVT